MLQDIFNPAAAAPAQAPATPPQQASQPPATPQELETRKAGWSGFFDKIDNDPELRGALLNFGTQMLAGKTPGQSDGSLFANSVQNSIRHLQMERERKADKTTQAEKDALAAKETTAGIANTEATTAQTTATTAEVGANAASTRDARGEQAAATTKNAETNATNAQTNIQAVDTKARQVDANIVNDQGQLEVSQQNADSTTLNAQANAASVKFNQLLGEAKLLQGEESLRLTDMKIRKTYEAAMAKTKTGSQPSAEMQLISFFISKNGGDIDKGVSEWRKVQLADKVAGNQALSSATNKEGVPFATQAVDNLMEAGTPDTANPADDAALLKAQQSFPTATVSANGDGTYNVIVDGVIKGTMNPSATK